MITADIQGLTPTHIVSLFEVDATAIGADILRFHGYARAGSIWWQGIEYSPWPIKAEGFSRTSDRPPTPTLTVGNIDNSISALALYYQDMIGARVTRKRTLGKYLDAVNFAEGNPTADPGQHFPDEIWYIKRKANEEENSITFELAGYDLHGRKLPGRQIIADHCSWITIGGYRGPYCGYTGPPVATKKDVPTNDPLLDRCSGKVSGCELRFGEGAPQEDPDGLPFGSFPAAGLLR